MASEHEKRVAAASLIGGSIEYYEFFIYGLSASLVFNKVFFPSFDALAGTLLSLSTFAVAFLARPVGAWVAGHFGDRIGRKSVLILTLVGMGGATTLIGCLPTYDSIGVAAPILLVVLRIIQGISVGGETTGGFLMTFEHSRRGRRPGFFTGAVSTGNVCGLLLANGAFFLTTLLPDGSYRAWGWRLPFLFSLVLVGIGLYVRSRLAESPDFEESKAHGVVSATPAIDVLRQYPWTFVGIVLITIPQSICFYIASVFAITYGKSVGVSSAAVTVAVMCVSALLIVGMPFFGWLSDRTGKPKLIFGIGMLIMAVAPFVWFPLVNTGSFPLLLLGFVLLLGGFGVNYGTQGLLYPSFLPPHLRYSGIGVAVALGGVLGGAFAPLIAIWLFGTFNSWIPVAVYMSATAAVGVIATVLLRVRHDEQPESHPDQAAGFGTGVPVETPAGS
jgi:MFS family permease